MKRAGWFVVLMSLAGCLEPGDFENPTAIYEAHSALDSGLPGSGGAGGSGGSGGMSGSGGSGGMSGSGGSGGMSGSGGSGAGGGDAAMNGPCGDVLEDLIKPTCASQTFCHPSGASLDLESDDIGGRLIGTMSTASGCEDIAFIDGENPEQSLIYIKLDPDPPCGEQMPFTGDKLTDEQKACVLEYIEQVVDEQ